MNRNDMGLDSTVEACVCKGTVSDLFTMISQKYNYLEGFALKDNLKYFWDIDGIHIEL